MFAMGPAFFQRGGYGILALTGTFPAATVGTPYSASLAISGGLAPYSLTGGTGVASGSLPAGLSLAISGSTLVLSGTPTAAATSTFTASVGSTDLQTATSAQSVVTSATQTTWSATNKASDIVLSSGNTIASSNLFTQTGGTVLSASGKTTGKFYYEIESTYNNGGHGGAVYEGLYPGIGGLSGVVGAAGAGWCSAIDGSGNSNRKTFFANSATNTLTGVATNFVQRAHFAVDIGAGKIWMTYAGFTSWVGGGDPALGNSPTFTFTPGGSTYYIAACPRDSDNTCALIAPASWELTAPTGFGVWT